MAYDSAKLFSQVRAILDRTPRTKLADVARQLQVDRHTVEKAVRAHAHQSYRAFQNALTLAQAFELLAEPRLRPIKEVSALPGYQSARAFGRFILKATGKTATELRASYVERKPST